VICSKRSASDRSIIAVRDNVVTFFLSLLTADAVAPTDVHCNTNTCNSSSLFITLFTCLVRNEHDRPFLILVLFSRNKLSSARLDFLRINQSSRSKTGIRKYLLYLLCDPLRTPRRKHWPISSLKPSSYLYVFYVEFCPPLKVSRAWIR